ncbi:CD209 antigen-like protein 2 [Tachysurus vachellii]|uniref:CD209 antigen-like protein 2 n=1 Tax=Tachysurus vachellii TaxID=175792 RepID=UPI00296B3BCE|nr:CD209 antigen-like protein 2 [Tachysurus vachellii]
MAVNLEMNTQFEAPNYLNVERQKKIFPSPARNTQYGGAFRLAGVCIGLMCIVQATLNIVLRLYFTSELLPLNCNNDTVSRYIEQLNNRYDNLVKEKSSLRNMRDQLQTERDKLQEKLSNIAEELKKPGWTLYRSSFYYMSAEKKNWFDSRAECRKNGADLVIIKSREEQDFIDALRSGKSAWIGLSDQVTEGTWKWVDNTSLTTNYWWSKEPNNFNGDEDCAEIGYIPDDGRPVTNKLNTWNDNSCLSSLFWICEKSFPI